MPETQSTTKPQTETQVQAAPPAIPTLPCPNCGANLLQEGFYNYCRETVSLREDNDTRIINGRLYLDHDEHGHETEDHQCATEAHCSACDTTLPWALYQIRVLDGELLPDAEKMIAELLAETTPQPSASPGPEAQT